MSPCLLFSSVNCHLKTLPSSRIPSVGFPLCTQHSLNTPSYFIQPFFHSPFLTISSILAVFLGVVVCFIAYMKCCHQIYFVSADWACSFFFNFHRHYLPFFFECLVIFWNHRKSIPLNLCLKLVLPLFRG